MLIEEIEVLWNNLRGEPKPDKGYQEKCPRDVSSKADLSRENLGREKKTFYKQKTLFMKKVWRFKGT